MRWFVTGTEGTPLGLDATTRTWRVCVTITSAGTSNKGEGSQRADVGQRPRRPFRGSLGSRKRRSHPQERARIHHQRGRDHVPPSSAFTPASPFRSPAGARGLNLRLHAASRSHRSSPHRQPRLVLACLCSPADQVLGPAVPSGTSVLLAPPQASVHKETGRDGGDRRRTAHDPTTAASPRLPEHDHGG